MSANTLWLDTCASPGRHIKSPGGILNPPDFFEQRSSCFMFLLKRTCCAPGTSLLSIPDSKSYEKASRSSSTQPTTACLRAKAFLASPSLIFLRPTMTLSSQATSRNCRRRTNPSPSARRLCEFCPRSLFPPKYAQARFDVRRCRFIAGAGLVKRTCVQTLLNASALLFRTFKTPSDF